MKLHELIMQLQQFLQKYEIVETKIFSMLESFCENYEPHSFLSYQLTPLLINIASLSEINSFLEEQEIDYLMKNPFTDKELNFIENAFQICDLAGEIFDEMYESIINHPVIKKTLSKENMYQAENDYYNALYNLYILLHTQEQEKILSYMEDFDQETLNIYEPYYEQDICPKLVETIQKKNMFSFFSILSRYIHFKICLEAGVSLPLPNDQKNQSKAPLVCSQINEYLEKTFGNHTHAKRMEKLFFGDLFINKGNVFDTDQQKINDLLEIINNRSQAQKAYYFYYNLACSEVEEYLEKCKKL